MSMKEEEWIEENCECGLDENGVWQETVFEEAGCTCREGDMP